MMCIYIETYQITRQICNSNWFGVRIPRLSQRDKQHLPSPKTKGRLKLCWNISGQKNPITYNFQTYVGVRECVRVCGWVWRSVWSSVCLVCVCLCVCLAACPTSKGCMRKNRKKLKCVRVSVMRANMWMSVYMCESVCQCVWVCLPVCVKGKAWWQQIKAP